MSRMFKVSLGQSKQMSLFRAVLKESEGVGREKKVEGHDRRMTSHQKEGGTAEFQSLSFSVATLPFFPPATHTPKLAFWKTRPAFVFFFFFLFLTGTFPPSLSLSSPITHVNPIPSQEVLVCYQPEIIQSSHVQRLIITRQHWPTVTVKGRRATRTILRQPRQWHRQQQSHSA